MIMLEILIHECFALKSLGNTRSSQEVAKLFGIALSSRFVIKQHCFFLGTIGLIVAHWKFDFLKTSTLFLEA